MSAYRSAESRRRFGVPSGPYTGGPHTVDLERLPADVQAELAARLRDARPILAKRRTEPVVTIATVLIGLAAVTAVVWCGFGDVYANPQQDLPWALLYAAIGAAIGATAAPEVRRPRWPEGRFLFPLDLVEIDGTRMRVVPFGDTRLIDIDEERRRLTLHYETRAPEVVTGTRAAKASLLSDLLGAQHSLEEATLHGASPDDVLASLRSRFAWEDIAPRAPAPSGTAKRVVSTLLGALLALAGWEARGSMHDDAAFAHARRIDTAAAYDSYLSFGLRHAREVREDHRPRVDYVVVQNDIVLLDRFLREHATAHVSIYGSGRRQLHVLCSSYALDPSADSRCDRRANPPDVTPCTRPEETICAPELVIAEVDRAFAGRDDAAFERIALREMDPDVAKAAHDEMNQQIKLVQSDIATCGQWPLETALQALLDLATKRHAPAKVALVVEGTLPALPDLYGIMLDFLPRPAVTLTVESDAEADAHWYFRRDDDESYLFRSVGVGGSGAVNLTDIPRLGPEPRRFDQERDFLAPLGMRPVRNARCRWPRGAAGWTYGFSPGRPTRRF